MKGLSSVRHLSRAEYVCKSCRAQLAAYRDRRHFITIGVHDKPKSRLRSASSQPYSPKRTISVTSPLDKTHKLLPDKPVRTRFAPSPTGYLHLGSLRTALFNYLLAKRTNGRFILRVEDTDQKRLVADAEERLFEDLRWAGIQWDEGPQVGGQFGPYKQSERTKLYQTRARDLLDSGAAYRCFCSPNKSVLEDADPSQIATNVGGGCQRDCQGAAKEESSKRANAGDKFVIRFSKPAVSPRWNDLVYGTMTLDTSKTKMRQRASIDDVVLLKSDGTPTYHLANVVDDHAMEITHVIRGTEWMPSTALHVGLYNAFGWTPPEFAHVGLLTDKDHNKLSKRNFDTDVRALKKMNGILPESLANFLALQGWRNPQKSDVMDLEELTQIFDLKFTRGNTIVSLDKLWYLQRHHARKRIDDTVSGTVSSTQFHELVEMVKSEAETRFSVPTKTRFPGARDLVGQVTAILLVDRGSYENYESYVERNRYFFSADPRKTLPPVQTFNEEVSPSELESVVARFLAVDEIQNTLKSLDNVDASDIRNFWQSISDASTRCNKILADMCHEQTSAMLGGHTDASAIEKTQQYKNWTKAIHLYLRERLSYGLPCPSTGYVLAVLGYDEVLRRVNRVSK